MPYRWISLLILCLLLASCVPEPDPLTFFEVTTEPFERGTVPLGVLVLEGNLTVEADLVDEYGFFFSTDEMAVAAADPAVAWPADSIENRTFRWETDPLEEDTTYYFRAFARRGVRLVTGDIDSFRLGLDLRIEQLDRRRNDTVCYRLSLTGHAGLAIEEVGYYLYEIVAGERQWVRGPVGLGAAVETDFAVGFPRFNADYRIAPYVRAGKVYDGPEYEYPVRIADGWRPLPTLRLPTGLIEASVVTTPTTIYVLGGCQGEGDANVNRAVYALRDYATRPPTEWTWEDISSTFCADLDQVRTVSGVSLWEDGRLYTGLGLTKKAGFNVFQLYPLDGPGQACADCCSSEVSLVDAVVFKEAGQWYIGSGRARSDSDAFALPTNRFYRFDPTTLDALAQIEMDTIARLPLRLNNQDQLDVPREGAVTLRAGGHRYVGTGLAVPDYRRDFYRFVSPGADGEPATWAYANTLPSAAAGRSQAIAFSVNGRGFVGMGATDGACYLNDLWELDSLGQSWRARQPLPGQPRSGAIAFTVGNRACVCGGDSPPTICNPDGTDALPDCWLYEPAQND